MTARTLLSALRLAGCRPAADGADLVLAAGPPPGLAAALGALHTGIRAVLTDRQWVGLPPDGRATVLDPDAAVPPAIKYLAVMGDRVWDRVPSAARLDLPDLFDADPPADAHKKQPRPRAA